MAKDILRYEITKRYDRVVIETTATLDHARDRSAKLSSKDPGVGYVVWAFDNGKRVVCSMSYNGKVRWTMPCRVCKGEGKESKYDTCYNCDGLGVEEDPSS